MKFNSPIALSIVVASLIPATALAQRSVGKEQAAGKNAKSNDSALQEDIVVSASTPLLGTGLNADKVPNATHVFGRHDLARTGEASLTGTLDNLASSVNLNSTIGNPNQPDLQFRGFTASPLQGLPQGLAVYQNGMRINESFGDTVNWDMIPMAAVDSMNLTSSNPVFGFNALGGAVALQMKNGRTWQGNVAEVSTGSFGRFNATGEVGRRWDDWNAYLAASRFSDSGWRERMPSRGVQVYSDFGYDNGASKLHLTFNAADNYLVGTGPTPEALLERYPRTAPGLNYPASNKNRMYMAGLQGEHDLADQLRLQANLYVRWFRQRLINGNVTDASPCEDDPTIFCSSGTDNDEFPLYDPSGRRVPVTAGGDYPAELDWAHTGTLSRGGSLMLTRNAQLFGHDNHLVIGASHDRGTSTFDAGAEIGTFDLDRVTHGSGLQVDSEGAIRQTRLRTWTQYTGIYLSNTFDIDDHLSLTINGRYNIAGIRLRDRLGGALNGDHRFSRFNPGVGATWRFAAHATAYVNYAETNRVPTAAELSCADPEIPCTMASFFMADPPLYQVVSRTWEGGLRGTASLGAKNSLKWSASLFRTVNINDIIEIASSIPGRGYFQNAARTRRQGIEIGTNYRSERLQLFGNYSLIDATYRSALTLSSPFNPGANDDGEIFVTSGDRIPGIPRHRVKLGADYLVMPGLTAGFSAQAASNQVLFQDQSNQTPRLPGYVVVGVHGSYELLSGLSLFGSVSNLFDRRYSVYGTWTDASGVPFPQLPGGEIGVTRSFGAAPPRAIVVGIKARI